MELRARGRSVRAAAREVGVSRSSGTNWSRGHKTNPQQRHSRVPGAAGSLGGRQISSRYLSQDQRIEIADLRQSGLSLRAIASQLKRAPSTISREMRRNVVAGRGYRPFDAHRRASVRRARHCWLRVDINDPLGAVVAELLLRRWRPRQISRHLRLRFVDHPSMWLCHESIYHAVYQPNSRLLCRSRLAPHRRSPLRTGREHRQAHQHQQRQRPRFQQPMLGIHDLPFPVDDRSGAGHLEGDLSTGNNHLSAIDTLLERQTRMVPLVALPRNDADSLHAALVARMRDLPPTLMRSITWDQGTEMARHLATTDKHGVLLYFCDSRSPWQRGTNENNGLLRDYFPKGVRLTNHPPAHLSAVRTQTSPPHSPPRPLSGRTIRRSVNLNGPSVLRR